MLSKQTLDHLLEAQSHLRAALKSAATNEKPFMCKHLADMIVQIDTLERTENMMDMLENRKSGDSGSFGAFFND